MKVLVTGGAGFIGGYVVEELLRRNHEPIVFDRYKRSADCYPMTNCEFYLGDVTVAEDVVEGMAHTEAWIHLAAVLGTQETIQNPRPAAMANLTGGLNVLEAAAQYDLPGTYIGVGNYWMNNTYSITKTMIERFVGMFNQDRGTRVNIVRAMNAYGPRQIPAAPYGPAKVRKITPSFICRALAGDPIEIYGNGKQVSDMIYVTDVALALVCAMEAAAEGEVYEKAFDAAPVEHNTVLDVAKLIVELTGSGSEIVHLPMRPGEIPNSTVTGDPYSMNVLGIVPEKFISLEDGMRQTVKWYR